MKYNKVLRELEENVIYSPGSMARFARDKDILPGIDENSNKADTRLAMQRVRISMGRFAKNHGFPQADGVVTLIGQAPVPGWFGWRWKASIGMPMDRRTWKK